MSLKAFNLKKIHHWAVHKDMLIWVIIFEDGPTFSGSGAIAGNFWSAFENNHPYVYSQATRKRKFEEEEERDRDRFKHVVFFDVYNGWRV